MPGQGDPEMNLQDLVEILATISVAAIIVIVVFMLADLYSKDRD